MSERFLKYLGAGLIAAGVSAAMFGGVGIATAKPDKQPGSDGASSSQDSNSTAGQSNSKNADAGSGSGTGPADGGTTDGAKDRGTTGTSSTGTGASGAGTGATGTAVTGTTGTKTDDTDKTITESGGTESDDTDKTITESDDTEIDGTEVESRGSNTGKGPAGKNSPATESDKTVVGATFNTPEVTPAVDDQQGVITSKDTGNGFAAKVIGPEVNRTALVGEARSAVDDTSPVLAKSMTLAAAAAVAPAAVPVTPSIVNVIGSLLWSVFDFVNKILQGPPVVPVGSGLKVGRSDLLIDCGDGYVAEADWYFPEDGDADKIIYFQHGILATSGFYNVTAAELAARNNAIVVAPSITSDFFACDACNLIGDPMHAAVGALFTGDRAALTASAQVAAARAGVEFTGLPDKFVIAGHSAGGLLAAGAAGYYYDLAPAAEKSNLVGVLLFDTSASDGFRRALAKLPTTLPVLHVSATPGPFNSYGDANEALEAARPGLFNGVRLIGGSHSDAFRSSTLSGITQLIVSIGTGFSSPENVEAVQVLAQGWITDMYAGTVFDTNARTGIYGALGSVVDVPTPGVGTGVARAEVLPVPPAQLNIIEYLIKASFGLLSLFQGLAICAEDPGAVFARQNAAAAELSTQNTALSLDGRPQTGQSVEQHVCTGNGSPASAG